MGRDAHPLRFTVTLSLLAYAGAALALLFTRRRPDLRA
jgi:hypothetical protein